MYQVLRDNLTKGGISLRIGKGTCYFVLQIGPNMNQLLRFNHLLQKNEMFLKMSYQVLQSPKGQPDKRWNIFAGLKEAHVTVLFSEE